jgi:hypothetical protein
MELNMKGFGKMTTSMEKGKNIVLIYVILKGIDKSWYDGDYVEGKKEGYGNYNWPDGSTYQGGWKENKIDGEVDYPTILIHK